MRNQHDDKEDRVALALAIIIMLAILLFISFESGLQIGISKERKANLRKYQQIIDDAGYRVLK